MDLIRVIITAACLYEGEHREPGTVLELERSEGLMLVSSGRARWEAVDGSPLGEAAPGVHPPSMTHAPAGGDRDGVLAARATGTEPGADVAVPAGPEGRQPPFGPDAKTLPGDAPETVAEPGGVAIIAPAASGEPAQAATYTAGGLGLPTGTDTTPKKKGG